MIGCSEVRAQFSRAPDSGCDSHRTRHKLASAQNALNSQNVNSSDGARVRFHPTSGTVRLCSPDIDRQAAGNHSETSEPSPMGAQRDEQDGHNDPLPVISYEFDCLFHNDFVLLVCGTIRPGSELQIVTGTPQSQS